MDWGVENCDISCGNCFTNSHTIYEAKNQNFIDSTKKGNRNVSNLSEMEDTVLQGGVGIGVILTSSTLHQYFNMGCNNESHYPLINGKITPSNNSSVSTLTSTSDNSRNDKVFWLQKSIHKKIKYSYLSKNQARYVWCASDIMKKQVKISAHKIWHYIILEVF